MSVSRRSRRRRDLDPELTAAMEQAAIEQAVSLTLGRFNGPSAQKIEALESVIQTLRSLDALEEIMELEVLLVR